MPVIISTMLDDTLPVIKGEARFTEQYLEVLSKLCWRIEKPLHSGTNTDLPYWGTVIAKNQTEGVDMATSETMSDTNVRFTPGEVGVKLLVTHKAIRDNQEDVIRAGGAICGAAMVVKRETDLAGQLDDATSSMGAANTTLSLGHLAAAWATLAGNALASGGPAKQPYVAVHHPFVLLDLVDIFTPTIAGGTTPLAASASATAEQALANYIVGRLFGMSVYSCGNIPIDSDADAKGGVFASGKGGGLVLVTAKEWDFKPTDDWSARATELVVVGEYAVGEYLAGWIVELYNDATAPA